MGNSNVSQRTKQTLAETLKRCLTQKGLSKITVSEILDECGVNRQTFYYHFRDIFDLLRWMFKEETEQFIQKYSNHLGWEDGMRLFLRYIEGHAYLRQCALDSLSRDNLLYFFRAGSRGIMRDVVAEMARNYNVSNEYVEFLSNFHLEAFAGMTVRWLQGEQKMPVEQFLSYLRLSVLGNVDHSLSEAEKNSYTAIQVESKSKKKQTKNQL